MAHMAFWTIEHRANEVGITFRQGETVQDCGTAPHAEVDQLLAWLFFNPEGAQQFDRIDSTVVHGWVLATDESKN